jgi:hypothetical protein
MNESELSVAVIRASLPVYEATMPRVSMAHAMTLLRSHEALLAALKEAREVIETLGHAGPDQRGVEGCNHCGFPWDGEHDPEGCCVPPALKQINEAIAQAERTQP